MQKTTFFLFILTILNCQNLFAQTSCSIDQVQILGQCAGSAVYLDAQISGTLSNIPNALQWTQETGATFNIKDANKAKAVIAPALSSGTYSFKITAQCEQGGNVEKIITHTIFSKPNAGKDTISCENVIFLKRNAPSGSKWAVVPSSLSITSIHPVRAEIGDLTVEGDFFLP